MDETIYLFTENFSFYPKVKTFVKKVLGKNSGGPKAVMDSLSRGLKELKVDFKVDMRPPSGFKFAGVLSGPSTLKWAIGQKRKSLIKHLVAGPNIVITPNDYNGLILNPAIDSYVVPSELSVGWWLSMNPEFKDRLKIWPAGVQDLGENRDVNGRCLVYKKKFSASLYKFIIGTLERQGIRYYVVEYGRYDHKKYLADFASTKFAIFLSESESQGLALHEAWMANVPTLVWNREYFEYQGKRWDYPSAAAPYLTGDCGLFFKDKNDFPAVLENIANNYNHFNPRAYSLKNFSDVVSAKRYLEIIRSNGH